MAIFKIEEAQREGARLVIGLSGISGSGKTRTALELAYGLANFNAKKVGFIDTENRRGRLYADVLRDQNGVVQRFLIGDFIAPFSPQRYVEAINAFVAAGVEVLVIDSVSHEWEGIGGCEDIAEGLVNGKAPKNKRWNVAKAEHKKFMNAMLQSPLHVICCIRARSKVKIAKVNNETVYEDQGVQPVQEKNFSFELTASLMMWSSGQQREVLKCPEELVPIFGQSGAWAEGYLTAQHGQMLRQWVDGGGQIDPAVQHAWDNLAMTCEQGLAALQAAWRALPENIRKAIDPNGCPPSLKESAAAYDQQAAQLAHGDSADVEDLNNMILGESNV